MARPRRRALIFGTTLSLVALSVFPRPGIAQERAQEKMTVDEYDPRSMLVVPGSKVMRSKYPFIDVHGHANAAMPDSALESLVRQMDAINLKAMVNLSGGQGERLATGVKRYTVKAPGRFVSFANLDFRGIDDPDWAAKAAAQFERDVKEGGAAGLKIFKNLGMDLKDGSGKRVRTDDARLDPVWRKAGELGVPVLIHTAEPPAFFEPLDKTNERWLELTQFPGRARPADRYPPFDSLMAEQHRMFKRHPKTQFISAHLSWLGADLGRLGRTLDTIPNMHVELGAVIYELGRQPRYANEFFLKYQDRILMGKDTFGGQDEFAVYFRVLESRDEYFDYYRRRHAFWKMYGLGLPDSVLKKVYYKNALRLVPAIDKSGFPQ